jgi:PAS domain S-box-containing protein
VVKDFNSHHEYLEGVVPKFKAELLQTNDRLDKEIKEREKAEKSLCENIERFRIYFLNSNDVLFSYDNRFRLLNISPNVERILGYKPKELIGRPMKYLNLLHPADLDEAIDNSLNVLSNKRVHTSIYQFITKGGVKKFCEVCDVPIVREGRVTEVVSVARTITDCEPKVEDLKEYCIHLERLLNERTVEYLKADHRLKR